MNILNYSALSLKVAAEALTNGFLVAFATETVYGLGVDALNKKAVERLYKVKDRPLSHPVIIHIADTSLINLWTKNIPEYAVKLSKAFWPGPMTLILPRTELAKDFVTGGQDTVAIRIPSNLATIELLKEFKKNGGLGVAAPSANRFGKVSPTTAKAVEIGLGNFLSDSDIILDSGPSQIGIESTIIDCTQELPIILRPGSLTQETIQAEIKCECHYNPELSQKIKAPGMLTSHYSPNARIFLDGLPSSGDGFIAMDDISTPEGAIRLASPKNSDEFAKILYESLRTADSKGLARVFVVPPENRGIGVAINDRLTRASN